jgi:hypothetical protein
MSIEKAVMSQAVDHDGPNSQSRLADYYRWIEPDRGTCIYINFDAADRLQRQVLRGLDSNRGVELGGILLGRSTLEGERITAIIDDFESVPCSYSDGSRYRAEATRFSAVRSRFNSAEGSDLSIIGYYRSHVRDDLYLSPEDLTLIQSVFPESDNVFLLIKPLAMRACTAGFFFREDGRIQSEFTLEVPFAPLRPSSSVFSDAEAIEDLLLPARLDQSVELTPVPQPQPQKPTAAHRERWFEGGRGPATVVLGIALSVGIWILAYWHAERPASLSPAAAIQDLPGKVEPAPIPPPSTSSVRAEAGVPASPRLPPATSSSAPDPHKLLPQQPAKPPAIAQARGPVVADVKPERPSSSPGETKPAETKSLETKTAEAIPPPSAVNPKPEVPKPAPQEVAPRQSEPVSILPSPSTPPTPAAPAVLPPAPAPTFAGPQVISRVNPAVPLDVRALISDETQIDVTVTIDAGGKAIDAQVTSSRGAAARLVAPEAIKAAKLFRFQPARENERAVQSKMVLTFRFKRPGS